MSRDKRQIGWSLLPSSLLPVHGRVPEGRAVFRSRDEAVAASKRAKAERADKRRVQLGTDQTQVGDSDLPGTASDAETAQGDKPKPRSKGNG